MPKQHNKTLKKRNSCEKLVQNDSAISPNMKMVYDEKDYYRIYKDYLKALESKRSK
jgi:hypothetical protein